MECELAQQKIALFAYGELPDDQCYLLEGHLATCKRCQEEYSAVQALQQALHKALETYEWDYTIHVTDDKPQAAMMPLLGLPPMEGAKAFDPQNTSLPAANGNAAVPADKKAGFGGTLRKYLGRLMP